MNKESQALQEFKRTISAKYEILVKAFATNNAKLISEQFFTPEALAVGEGEETAIGNSQIENLYSEFVGVYQYAAKSFKTTVQGDFGWDFADVLLTPVDKQADDHPHPYKVLYIWSKEGGEWLCKGQMYVEGSFAK